MTRAPPGTLAATCDSGASWHPCRHDDLRSKTRLPPSGTCDPEHASTPPGLAILNTLAAPLSAAFAASLSALQRLVSLWIAPGSHREQRAAVGPGAVSTDRALPLRLGKGAPAQIVVGWRRVEAWRLEWSVVVRVSHA